MQTVHKMESKFIEFFLTLNHRNIPYIAEVALRMPVLALIHLWMLFSPESDYWILSLPCFMIRYGVSCLLIGHLDCTRSRLLFFYIFAMPLLFFGPAVNSLQESVTKLASGESTFQFSRLALATVTMILFIIFFQKLYVPPKFSIIMWLSTFLILILISFVWLFSLNIFVSLVYWITKLLFTAIFIFILFVNFELKGVIGQIADIMKQCQTRDMLVLFGLSYYTYAITCELKCGMPLLDVVSYQGLNYIISICCTSVIVLDSIVSIFVMIVNIVIIIIIYSLVAEEVDTERLRPLIYIGKANNILAPFYIFAMQTGVLRVDGETKPDVVSALLHFTLVILLTKIWFTLEPFLNQLGANAAERKLRVHIGVVTFSTIIVICSLLLSLNIAAWLQIGLWPIINCFGWLGLVTTSTMTLMCYMVNILSWLYDMDITKTQDIIYYIRLSKSISIVVCAFLEGYHRLFFPIFSQNIFWLIVHGILIMLGQVYTVFQILRLEYVIYMQRTKSRAVVQSLPQATPDQVAHLDDVCSICMYEIDEGLVTPCNHIFHSECIRRACTIRPSCPMCNQPLC
ncbi:hypothetical protein ACJMK2_018525 [Sinanodonta woodiana]|uniref:RING-type domain-containing protein n=1 Tax=Sinanodonta woodiana TaxID=1069815 RepID=A0ABD3UDS1_SINWO